MLPSPKGREKESREREPGKKVAPPKGWSEAVVRRQRLFFNPWLVGTRLAQRSDAALEVEAIAWARAGVTHVQHIVVRDRIMTDQEFLAQYAHLRVATLRLFREAIPVRGVEGGVAQTQQGGADGDGGGDGGEGDPAYARGEAHEQAEGGGSIREVHRAYRDT
jgi:hypothetical protein